MPDSESLPIVSLLVAMRNEAHFIERCLRSILSQEYPIDCLEVFVFDGQSTDGSWETAEKLIHGHPLYHLLPNPEQIQSEAWNKGILRARGEVIGIVSAHAELAPDYVSKAIAVLQRTQADMVGGPTRAHSDGYVGTAIAIAMSTPFGVGGANFRYTREEKETDTVFMGLCKRSMYQQIGGFDMEMVRNQDDELSYRLLKNGGRIVCSPSIRSTYYNRSSLSSLWRQYFQYGWYKVRVLQKHPFQMRPRHFVPPLFVLALIASLLLALFPVFQPLAALIPLTYLLASLLYSFHTASRQGSKYIFVLPAIYAVLHLSYGLGFLLGLGKFWNRWNDREGKVPRFSHDPSG